MATQIKLRRDTYTNWYDSNPVLGLAEPGYDTTNSKLKIGDGTTAWRDLPYFDDKVTDFSAIATDILPDADNTRNIGSPDKRWQHGYFASGSLYVGDIKLSNNAGQLVVQQVTDAGLITEAPVPDTPGVVTTDRIVNGANTFVITAAGALELNGSTFTGGGGGSTDRITANGIDIYVNGNGSLVLPATDTELVNTAIVASTANIRVSSNGTPWTFDSQGFISLPNGNVIDTGVANKFIMETGGDTDFEIFTIGAGNTPLTSTWTFGRDGSLQLPAIDTNGYNYQFDAAQNTNVLAGSAPTVVFNSVQSSSLESVKAIVKVSVVQAAAGGLITRDSQVCEMLITSKNSVPEGGGTMVRTAVGTIYGVTHTSTNPLATFSVNFFNNPNGPDAIQILAEPTAAVTGTSMDVQVVAIELMNYA